MMDAIHSHPIKLGRKASIVGTKLRMANYLDVKAILPKVPKAFGFYNMVQNWGGYLNDSLSDCVIAGAQHEHDLALTVTQGTPHGLFNDNTALTNYEQMADYNPADPNSDQGMDMVTAASYRRKTGIIDRNGKRHLIKAYVALDQGNFEQLLVCMYICGFTGLGMNFFDYNERQFRAGKPWDSALYGTNLGGHYIPGMGRDIGGNIVVITWGKVQKMTQRFYVEHVDESLAYFSTEWLLKSGKTVGGFDSAALLADLEVVSSARVVALNGGPTGLSIA